jgi:hypothetical protein
VFYRLRESYQWIIGILDKWWSALQESTNTNRVVAIATIVIAVATVVYVWVALRSTNINREALESVQRAFVFYSPEVTPSWVTDKVGSTKIISWTFFVSRKNTGTTGTRNFKEHVFTFYGPNTIPENFDFHDFEGGVGGTANPQESSYYQTEAIPVDVIEQAENGIQHIYIYGWSTYNDVFEGTPQRVTKFCFEIHPLSGDFTNTKGGPFGSRGNFCTVRNGSQTAHNCSDDDCKK